MTERGQVIRPLIATTVAAAAAIAAAYTFGPDAKAEKAGRTAAAQKTGQQQAKAEAITAADACTTSVKYPKRQLRGVWIATVHNLDWPSKPGLPPDRQKAEYVQILDNAVKRRLNAVFFQVRPASDAIYRSSLEPWSQWLTGTPGKDPGWDPLPFLVSEAHKRGLQFHAWFNPYRAADTAASPLPQGHPARLHPEWTVKHEGKLYYNPGLPQVRDWVTKVVTDVVKRYDVDGVHFDDYFYPYPGRGTRFADQAAYKKYGKGLSLADWRRRNVNQLVAQVSQAVHAAKPYAVFGISPFGIWRNKAQDPSGSATTGMSAYDSIYADAKAWIKAGSVDYVMPQLYWPRGFAAADYAVLAKWWADAVKGTEVDLYIGQALYRVGAADTPAWTKAGELPAHLTLNRRYPEISGDVYFSAAQLVRNPLGVLDRIVKEHYARPALPPVLRASSTPLVAPRGVKASGAKLTWQAQPGARAYGVYRVAGKDVACATADARNLVAVVPASAAPSYTTSRPGTYYVTTIDRLGNESPATRAS
ncbi:glycosyl hydrolase [Microbispora rosea subsp. aerata]|nr:family 10 glycosylhydrolase [Microbispora rosea]GGO21465.1 glycosyl hydrolase [Microbispora rosea subsp. aerata]GIH57366.1 glycosyl hydrolase [Microbispora rosea subsp. aerata]GLJ84178.1 glycosyl hydrolase [Microbispora rosea subsp. aerata]